MCRAVEVPGHGNGCGYGSDEKGDREIKAGVRPLRDAGFSARATAVVGKVRNIALVQSI
jgi:hypothetical protein